MNDREIRMVERTARAPLPVWQPPRPPSELLAADPEAAWDAIAPDDAALEAIPGEPAQDDEQLVPPWTGAAGAAGAAAPARRANSSPALLMVSALIAILGVGFAVGRVTAQSQSATGQPGAGGAGGVTAVQTSTPRSVAGATSAPLEVPGVTGSGLAAGTTVVSGTVTSVTSTSITIQQANGRTVTIAIGPSTTYGSQTTATSADVIPGATVVVQTAGSGGRERSSEGFGNANPGTVARTASSVTITSK